MALSERTRRYPEPVRERTARAWLDIYDRCFVPSVMEVNRYGYWIGAHESELLLAAEPGDSEENQIVGVGIGRKKSAGIGLDDVVAPSAVNALDPATWVVPCADGVSFRPDGLSLLRSFMRRHPEVRLWYTDHDRIAEDGGRTDPVFECVFTEERLLSGMPLGPVWAARKEDIASMGEPRPGDPQWEIAVQWNIAQKFGPKSIGHVPVIAAHRRVPPSAISLPALNRLSLAGFPVLAGGPEGRFRWKWGVAGNEQAVTLVLPTRDGRVLQKCLDTLRKTAWPSLRFTIMDNGSRKKATQSLLEKAARDDDRITVIRDDGPFNWSRLNNLGARNAQTPWLCLINDDVEATDPDWLRWMMDQANRPRTGAVGAMLTYPDGTVQHAGVALGLMGVAGHPWRGRPAALMPQGLAEHPRQVSAVTGACLLVSSQLYSQVGGCDERLAVAFNDVDLCLRIRAAGMAIRWTPYASLIHHESLTRGSDDSASKRRRFADEYKIMRERWRDQLESDPHYSPAMTWHGEDMQPSLIRRPGSAVDPSVARLGM